MPSTVTTPVVVRLPNDVVARIKKSAKRQGVSVSEYLGKILVLQLTRKR